MTKPSTHDQETFLPGTGWISTNRDDDADDPAPDQPDRERNRTGFAQARAALRAARQQRKTPPAEGDDE